MVDAFDPTQLEGINDVVQRAGFSDKRKRNLAIRTGMENQGQFQQQNASGIQQAQQPTEFLGAGRKMAANQNPDAGLASLFGGPLEKTKEGWQYYGDTDYSTAQAGTAGYDTAGIGGGKYNISKGGNNIGTGYYDPETARKQLGNNFNYDANSFGPGYSPAPYIGGATAGDTGTMGEWELLGQQLTGHPGTTDTMYSMPHNNMSENITGKNTLFGSTPIINNGKMLGYTLDPGPGESFNSNMFYPNKFGGAGVSTSKQGGDYGVGYRVHRDPSTLAGSMDYNTQLTRQLNDPSSWGNYGTLLNKDKFFLKSGNEDMFPGWTNNESYSKVFGDNLVETPWYTSALKQLSPLLGAVGGAGGLASSFVTNTALNALKGGGISSLFGGGGQGNISGAPVVNAAAANTKQPAGKLEGATNSGLNSLFNRGDVIRGSEFGNRGGSLSSFLNMNPQGKEMPQQFPTETPMNRNNTRRG
jgi:hypothetical protein